LISGFNVEFLTSRCGLLKVFEVVLGSCCETLLIRFGMPAAQDIGEEELESRLRHFSRNFYPR
jgi:hypothetical protein